MSFVIVIPARHASTRLPAKPLADIHGKPMVVRVAEQAAASGASEVWIACDDARIAEAATTHDIRCLLTRDSHTSGTDRLAEAADLLGLPDDTIVVNVQGDEPLIDPALIRQVADELASHTESDMATLCHPLHSHDDLLNPNIVKVVMNAAGHAMYFSRAPIPWPRDGWLATPAASFFRHMGIYAYRAGFLRQFTRLSPAPTETIESLEQLRALWHGYTISVGISQQAAAPGVDTASDLDLVRRLYLERQATRSHDNPSASDHH